MPSVRTDAIVLRLFDFSETSQVVAAYTREHGRLRLLAKGSKRSRNAFGGVLEPFHRYQFVFLKKPHGQLHLLTSAALLAPARSPRRNPEALCTAAYLSEWMEGLTPEGDPDPTLFEILMGAFGALETETSFDLPLLQFEVQALRRIGHAPRVPDCRRCGRTPDAAHGAYFSPREGGALCSDCQGLDPARIAVSGFSLLALADLMEDRPWTSPASLSLLSELRAVLSCFAAHLRERPLRTLPFLPHGREALKAIR